METHIEFTQAPIAILPVPAPLRETGAQVEFSGIVRQTEQARPIAGLHYEAHQPMAERQLRHILNRLSRTCPCQAVWFIHRLGWVPTGETSLYIRVHAPHRKPAFRLCMDLIDLLKKDVPIWKLTPPAPPGCSR
jgi:molybdopterin synthase catalytic subunit